MTHNGDRASAPFLLDESETDDVFALRPLERLRLGSAGGAGASPGASPARFRLEFACGAGASLTRFRSLARDVDSSSRLFVVDVVGRLGAEAAFR